MTKVFTKQKVSPLSKANIECKAQHFLEKAKSSHLIEPGSINVLELIDIYLPKEYGYKVELIDDNKSIQFEGAVIPEKKKIMFPVQIYNGIAERIPRCLFTGAHEISHVVLHSNQLNRRELIDFIINGYKRKDEIKPYEDPEWQANYMAGAILMPLSTLKPIVNELISKRIPEHNIVNKISSIYGVSNIAAEIRLNKTGLLTI